MHSSLRACLLSYALSCALSFLSSSFTSEATCRAAEPAPGRVLFLGLDGCRWDALHAARAPHLRRLEAEGCYSDQTLILGERFRVNDTVSGPGWSSLLTGVWADKHGALSNKFVGTRYDRYPHFFRRVKEARPDAVTVSLASWPPIPKNIVSHADVNYQTPDVADRYVPADRLVAARAVETFEKSDPTAVFVYFGQIDEHGHAFGFHPSVPEYVAAIERVDAHVGDLLTALRKRDRFAAENWLIVVSSDHGGRGRDHGGGHQSPEILNSFAIVHGAAARRGKLDGPTYLVDVPVTALHHLGVRIDPDWQLDGRPIGLSTRQ